MDAVKTCTRHIDFLTIPHANTPQGHEGHEGYGDEEEGDEEDREVLQDHQGRARRRVQGHHLQVQGRSDKGQAGEDQVRQGADFSQS